MAKDAIGNTLEEGALVSVALDSNRLRGRIRKIQTGGLAVAGSNQMTPGMIVINTDILVPLDPKNPVATNVERLVDPEAKPIPIV